LTDAPLGLRLVGTLAGVVLVVGLGILVLWAVGPTTTKGAAPSEHPSDHGLFRLDLSPQERDLVECMVGQLDRDPAWDRAYTILDVEGAGMILDLGSRRASVSIHDGWLSATDSRGSLYDEESECGRGSG
jgi:hypothetical protein